MFSSIVPWGVRITLPTGGFLSEKTFFAITVPPDRFLDRDAMLECFELFGMRNLHEKMGTCPGDRQGQGWVENY